MEERESKSNERERKSENSIVVFVSMLLTLTFVSAYACSTRSIAWHGWREKRENKHLMRAVFTFYSSCYYSYDWNG